jgi:hypothetical protein
MIETNFTWVLCPHCAKKLFKDYGSKQYNIMILCKGCKREVKLHRPELQSELETVVLSQLIHLREDALINGDPNSEQFKGDPNAKGTIKEVKKWSLY